MDNKSLASGNRLRETCDYVSTKSGENDHTVEERLAHNEGIATSLYELCLLIVQSVIKLKSEIIGQKLIDRLNEIAVDLRLWGGLTKTSKFEQCLASCPDIQHDVLSLLHGTGNCIRKLITLQSAEVRDALSKQLLTDLSIMIEKAGVVLDTDDDDDSDDAATIASSDGENSHVVLPSKKVIDIMDEISSNVELLMELTPTLERTYAVIKVQPLLSKPDPEPITFRVSPEALPYVSQVCDKFPKANLELIERLGEANWQRFCRLRLGDDEEPSAKEFTFRLASTFHDSGIGSSTGTRLLGSLKPVDHISSNESLASSVSSDHMHRLRVPPEPVEVAEGEPFKCQFCNQIQENVRNRNDWKSHVFQDLQPYICTYGNCPHMLLTFSNRKAWAQHEIECHLQIISYRCLICGMTFVSDDQLNRHHKHHIESSKGKQAVGTKFNSTTEHVDWKLVKCQLCYHGDFSTSRDYTNHVAKHMEEVALVVIPQDGDSDPESEHNSEPQRDPLARHRQSPEKPTSAEIDTVTYKCRHCFKYFSFKAALEAHMKMDRCDQEARIGDTAYLQVPPINYNREYILDLADPNRPSNPTSIHQQQATFQCHLCPKKFTRAYNLRSHLRTHTDERPFVCSVCGKAYARQHDRKRHESLHSGEKKFVCKGNLISAPHRTWGCGRRFARADALGRHFRSEAGRVCIKPLLNEEAAEKALKVSGEYETSSTAPAKPSLPRALLAQYPALQNTNLTGQDEQSTTTDF